MVYLGSNMNCAVVHKDKIWKFQAKDKEEGKRIAEIIAQAIEIGANMVFIPKAREEVKNV